MKIFVYESGYERQRMETFSSRSLNRADRNVRREFSPSVRERLDALRHWERRRETGECANVTVGSRVRYKDEPNLGLVTGLLDGGEGRKLLVGQPGAMVSFNGRAPVPIFVWALQSFEEEAQP
jgi:hypothetical protein